VKETPKMFEVINVETGEVKVVTLDEAARIAKLAPADVAWAVEKCGMCSIESYQIFAALEGESPSENHGPEGEYVSMYEQ
jgi:hypothetical protein